ncbi:MAG: hypothetical protein KDD58_15350 [Bdellovibrionales bacterium]|nr:hypothetical protein [Bdellovibrionales bacterium]
MNKFISLIFISLAVVGCGKGHDRQAPYHNDYYGYDNYNWPYQSPQTVIVRRNPVTGNVYYTTIDNVYSNQELERLIYQNTFNFRNVAYDRIIDSYFPYHPHNGLYFLERTDCVTRGNYQHYYPQSWGTYNGYAYFPSFYSESAYYYYQATHRFTYGEWSYYTFVRF